MSRPRRLVTIAHSYVVAHYRRLARELEDAGGGRWEVTAVAPASLRDILGPAAFEPDASEPSRVELVSLRLSRQPHLRFYSRRLREILREAWDLVHFSEEPYVVMGAQIARWTSPRTPYVFRTGQAISKSYPPPFSWLERRCLDRCAGWIGTDAVVEAMLSRGYGRKPYRSIPLGVDTARFKPSPESGAAARRRHGLREGGPPVVGYLGRFVPEKGLELLTGVLDRLRAPHQTLLVGEGPLEPSLRAWAAGSPLRRVVTGVRHGAAAELLNAMDILCLPSRTTPRWRESFGRVVAEAMACGLPVVGSDSGEIPRVLAGAGIVAPESDASAWIDAVGGLVADAGSRRRLGATARETALERYAWPVVARRHLEFFDEVLDGGLRTC